ncbi:hypothetical protein CBOM_07471 [Ceraceosorus bombacis]|uniref:Uncharacterized protein n=1 Tax=Ceraceosorus bombacis TaxID=401625 RepID=A0A0P1BA63_9BASI|nr:hypothetical protein CBOM_07471 [Ceraceosorus bombacis]
MCYSIPMQVSLASVLSKGTGAALWRAIYRRSLFAASPLRRLRALLDRCSAVAIPPSPLAFWSGSRR